jgi:hypothetical protein
MDALVTLVAESASFGEVFAADSPSHTGRCFESGHRCGCVRGCESGCGVDGCEFVDEVRRLYDRVE